MEMERVFFTPQEAADYLGVHVNTVRNATKRGDMKAYSYGTRIIRYKLEDLQHFINNQEN